MYFLLKKNLKTANAAASKNKYDLPPGIPQLAIAKYKKNIANPIYAA